MGRKPCCEKTGLRRGKWDVEEDQKLINYINANGEGSWRSLPTNAGLLRCGKSCRLRWINYLKTGLKRGTFTPYEDETIVKLHNTFGNKWSLIASHLAGRTDNEIKNYWNSHLSRRTYMFRSSSTAMLEPPPPNLADHHKTTNKNILSKPKKNTINKSTAKIKKNKDNPPPVSDFTTQSSSSSSTQSCVDYLGWVNEFMLEERETTADDDEMDEDMLLQFETFLQYGGDDVAADCNNSTNKSDDEKLTKLDDTGKDYGSNYMRNSCPSPIVIYFEEDDEFNKWDFDGGDGGEGLNDLWSEAEQEDLLHIWS